MPHLEPRVAGGAGTPTGHAADQAQQLTILRGAITSAHRVAYAAPHAPAMSAQPLNFSRPRPAAVDHQ